MIAAGLTVVVGGVAVALTAVLGGDLMLGAGTALGIGAIGAVGTRAGLALGILAVLVAASSPGHAPLTPDAAAAVVALALALAALARVLDPAWRHLTRGGAVFSALWLLVLGGVVMMLPDGWVAAYGADGQALEVRGVAREASSGLRASLTFGGLVPYRSPAAAVSAWFPYLAALAAFGLLAARTRVGHPKAGLAWWGVVVTGAVLVFVGAKGLVETTIGAPIEGLTQESLSAAINRAGGGRVAVESLQLPGDAMLAIGSRPVVDAMRLFVGLMLAALAAVRLRRHVNQPEAVPARANQSPPACAQPFVMVAIISAVAAAMITAGGQQLVLTGVVMVLVGALVASQFGHVSRRGPYGAVVLAFALAVYAWVAPVAGWLSG